MWSISRWFHKSFFLPTFSFSDTPFHRCSHLRQKNPATMLASSIFYFWITRNTDRRDLIIFVCFIEFPINFFDVCSFHLHSSERSPWKKQLSQQRCNKINDSSDEFLLKFNKFSTEYFWYIKIVECPFQCQLYANVNEESIKLLKLISLLKLYEIESL